MKICLKSSVISCRQILRVHKKGTQSYLQRIDTYEVERKLNDSIFRVPTGELLKSHWNISTNVRLIQITHIMSKIEISIEYKTIMYCKNRKFQTTLALHPVSKCADF